MTLRVTAADVIRAIENGSLELFFQPQVTQQGQVVAMEALLRWRREGEWVPPATVISVAESAGLISRITEFSLDGAAQQAAIWQSMDFCVKTAVNVTPADVAGSSFCETVLKLVRHHQLPPGAFGLEITEQGATVNPDQAARTLTTLRSQGVTVALDDFGTGHSSLSRLCLFPVDELKLDRMFVSRLADDERAAAAVRCVFYLAETLQLRLVVEGVETERERRSLLHLGSCLIQGYVHSPPMPANEATAWLAHHS